MYLDTGRLAAWPAHGGQTATALVWPKPRTEHDTMHTEPIYSGLANSLGILCPLFLRFGPTQRELRQMNCGQLWDLTEVEPAELMQVTAHARHNIFAFAAATRNQDPKRATHHHRDLPQPIYRTCCCRCSSSGSQATGLPHECDTFNCMSGTGLACVRFWLVAECSRPRSSQLAAGGALRVHAWSRKVVLAVEMTPDPRAGATTGESSDRVVRPSLPQLPP